ncbi:ChrR family anti-sigma-E factor [Kaistia dalseonensis]|uniref:Transcriptional regulator n=1 Tax=Kaistia dalseonensis TaxID=410840 RepID=A0ABU0H7K9_9HYPH|nr:ChrR family anti-sigma-E factor [Kaistia dalseonensis]MCX5495691.1 ChrR family anti-sigma-E factor [Kaistia dalseonensis]MDQ0438287.1 putative transcriptional regulator [Kaistia dalseonensis]
MTIRHKPSEETLLAYAAGTLRAPEAAVVATHLAFSRSGRDWVRTLQRVGGQLLDELPTSAMSPDALQRVMARIDADGGEAVMPAPLNDMLELPEPLRRYPLGPWRWLGRGTRVRSVGVPRDGDCRVILFKIDPGRKMPQHSHAGVELTCVVSGSYSDEAGRFGPGDFEEADEETNHRPIVDSDVPCICVVALDGQIRLQGVLGRLLQPLARL